MTTAVPEMAQRMAVPEDGSFDYWAPENVSSLVAWLVSAESKDVTGRVFEAEGGKISIADGWRSTEGVDKGARWEPAQAAASGLRTHVCWRVRALGLLLTTSTKQRRQKL